MKRIMFFFIVVLILVVSGCREEKEVINNLNFSDQYLSGIAGGWIRFASTLTVAEDAGRYNWVNAPSEFSTSLYVVEDIVSRCPDNPNFSYILFSKKGKEDNRMVSEQIFKDLQGSQKDLNHDGVVNQNDLDIVLKAGEQLRGDIQPAPEWIAMAEQLPKKNIAVQSNGKLATTWSSQKKEK